VGNRLSLGVVAALLLAVGVSAHAQWKWRDKSGQMHISDLPPPSDIAEKDILQRPGTLRLKPAAPAPETAAAPTAAPDTKPRVDPELEARRKRAEQEQAAQRKKDEDKLAAARVENCARAKDHLRVLEDGMRLARVNDKGEREIIDDKTRAEEIQRTRGVIASDCR
jgi:hypothetical protein